MLIYMVFVFLTFIVNPFYIQNSSNALNRCYSPLALWESRTASSAKASKNIYNIAISRMYRFIGLIAYRSKYNSRSGYTWSKNIQNSLGEAPSPYLTPLLISKLHYYYPSIHTTPLLLTYIFLINYTKLSGMFSLCAMSSHNVFLSTRSYAFSKSINSSPSGCLALTLYYTNYWTVRACSIVV
jgi:hypothetical protein